MGVSKIKTIWRPYYFRYIVLLFIWNSLFHTFKYYLTVCSNGFRESIDGTADDIDTKFAGSNSWRKSLMECGEACIIDSQCDMYQFSDIYWCKCLDKRECDCEWPAVRSSPSVKKPGTCSLARAVNRNVPTGETSFVVKWKQACIKSKLLINYIILFSPSLNFNNLQLCHFFSLLNLSL